MKLVIFCGILSAGIIAKASDKPKPEINNKQVGFPMNQFRFHRKIYINRIKIQYFLII